MKGKKSPKPVCFVQARMGGTRLPGKVLADINGKPMLQRVVERLKPSKWLKSVVVLTPCGLEQKPIWDLCDLLGVQAMGGGSRGGCCASDDEVLDRYATGAKAYRSDPIVRVTADCPFIDHGIVDGAITMLVKGKKQIVGGFDYVSNNLERSFPHGTDVEVFTAKALREANKEATDPYDREHVTEYIRRHQDRPYTLGNLRYPLESLDQTTAAILCSLRLTVDYPEDLELVRTLYAQLETDPEKYVTIAEVVELIKSKPELQKINEQRALDHAQHLDGSYQPISGEALAVERVIRDKAAKDHMRLLKAHEIKPAQRIM